MSRFGCAVWGLGWKRSVVDLGCLAVEYGHELAGFGACAF